MNFDEAKVGAYQLPRCLMQGVSWERRRCGRLPVIANNSGCAGGALSRRNFGETLHILSNVRPHWFCRNCREQSGDIHHFPVDQHMLIALCAPRPVLLSCAENDLPADSVGEFLALREADEVYRFLGKSGLPAQSFPPLNQMVGGALGYYIRPGEHDITGADWCVHLDFAERHLQVVRE